MKLTFLGTGAADYPETPEAFAKNAKPGEIFRGLSSLLIDDALLVDCSAGTENHLKKKPGALSGVSDILISHTHTDHYRPDILRKYCGDGTFGSVPCLGIEQNAIGKASEELGNAVRLLPLRCFEETKIGRYTVLPLPANHSIKTDFSLVPTHFVIGDGTKTLFYGCDGAHLLCRTFDFLSHLHLDGMILDCTFGEVPGDPRLFEHNDFENVLQMVRVFRKNGILRENGKVFLSHFSRFDHFPAKELCEKAKEHGMTAAYDGMEAEI